MTEPARRAVFFDRDGTLVDTLDYLGSPDDVHLLPGAVAALRAVGQAGWLRIIVTNQSGVARGYFTEDEYRVVEGRFLELAREGGADVDASYACFHLPIGAVPKYARICDCRKPEPGLFEKAQKHLGIDMAASVVVGDSARDLQAGRAAGVGTTVFVLTGKGRGQEPDIREAGLADHTLESVQELPALLESISP